MSQEDDDDIHNRLTQPSINDSKKINFNSVDDFEEFEISKKYISFDEYIKLNPCIKPEKNICKSIRSSTPKTKKVGQSENKICKSKKSNADSTQKKEKSENTKNRKKQKCDGDQTQEKDQKKKVSKKVEKKTQSKSQTEKEKKKEKTSPRKILSSTLSKRKAIEIEENVTHEEFSINNEVETSSKKDLFNDSLNEENNKSEDKGKSETKENFSSPEKKFSEEENSEDELIRPRKRLCLTLLTRKEKKTQEKITNQEFSFNNEVETSSKKDLSINTLNEENNKSEDEWQSENDKDKCSLTEQELSEEKRSKENISHRKHPSLVLKQQKEIVLEENLSNKECYISNKILASPKNDLSFSKLNDEKNISENKEQRIMKEKKNITQQNSTNSQKVQSTEEKETKDAQKQDSIVQNDLCKNMLIGQWIENDSETFEKVEKNTKKKVSVLPKDCDKNERINQWVESQSQFQSFSLESDVEMIVTTDTGIISESESDSMEMGVLSDDENF